MRNRFETLGDKTKVYSTGKNNHLHFYIDTADLEKISVLTWRIYVVNNGYKKVEGGIFSNGQKRSFSLGRFLLDAPKGSIVDHIDCDPTNNCRDNLRFATTFQNAQNAPKFKVPTTSRYKGVCFHKKKRLWFAYLNSNKKRFNLGYFRQEKDAAIAYNLKCKEQNIDFARLNEIR
jgi:hypothetical protein